MELLFEHLLISVDRGLGCHVCSVHEKRHRAIPNARIFASLIIQFCQIIWSCYSILPMLMDAQFSMHIGQAVLVPQISSDLLVYYQLSRQNSAGSWCHILLSSISSHWIKVQMTERLCPWLIAEFLFRSQGFLLLAASFVEIKIKHVTSIKYLQVPWDPGGIHLMHRLEGKPNLKKGEC